LPPPLPLLPLPAAETPPSSAVSVAADSVAAETAEGAVGLMEDFESPHATVTGSSAAIAIDPNHLISRISHSWNGRGQARTLEGVQCGYQRENRSRSFSFVFFEAKW